MRSEAGASCGPHLVQSYLTLCAETLQPSSLGATRALLLFFGGRPQETSIALFIMPTHLIRVRLVV